MPTTGQRVARWQASTVITTVVVLVAVAARWTLIAEAGLDGLHAYDDGVYYAGAAALVAGRVPYGDFLFLHPPGILLVLSPFAALGRLTSDPVGLAAARVAAWGLGALNAALVTRLAARYGLVPAAVAGLLYALWYPARYAERIFLLEPPGNTALLVALLLLTPLGRPAGRGSQVLAGAALGLAVCIKLWMVAPLLVLVLWQARTTGALGAVRVALGAAGAAVLTIAPFLPVGAPMFRMVVLDQLGRPSAQVPLVERLLVLGGLSPLAERAPDGVGPLALLAVGAVTVLAAVAAVRQPCGRLHVLLLAATLAVLVASPSVFHHYGTFAAVPLVLVLAAAVAEVQDRARRRGRRPGPASGRSWSTWPAGAAALAVSGLFALSVLQLPVDTGRDFPAARLRPAVADRQCVVSDDPTVLALLDVLSEDLRRGCPLLVDVTGLTYDRYARERPDGSAVPRPENQPWQRAILGYLTSGCAVVLAREQETGLSAATRSALTELPAVATAGRYTVRAQPSPCSSRAAVQGTAPVDRTRPCGQLTGRGGAAPDPCRPAADGRSSSPSR